MSDKLPDAYAGGFFDWAGKGEPPTDYQLPLAPGIATVHIAIVEEGAWTPRPAAPDEVEIELHEDGGGVIDISTDTPFVQVYIREVVADEVGEEGVFVVGD